MTEILTESFCERCGTRYTFESTAPRRARLGRVRVLGKGMKNFVLSDDASFSEAMADARGEEEIAATAHQLDAFHQTFNFCLTCRQYTCGDCWNVAEGRCLTCAPIPGMEEPLAAALPLVAADAVLAEPSNGHAAPEEAWPDADLSSARLARALGMDDAEAEAAAAAGAEDALEQTAPLIGIAPGQSLEEAIAEYEAQLEGDGMVADQAALFDDDGAEAFDESKPLAAAALAGRVLGDAERGEGADVVELAPTGDEDHPDGVAAAAGIEPFEAVEGLAAEPVEATSEPVEAVEVPVAAEAPEPVQATAEAVEATAEPVEAAADSDAVERPEPSVIEDVPAAAVELAPEPEDAALQPIEAGLVLAAADAGGDARSAEDEDAAADNERDPLALALAAAALVGGDQDEDLTRDERAPDRDQPAALEQDTPEQVPLAAAPVEAAPVASEPVAAEPPRDDVVAQPVWPAAAEPAAPSGPPAPPPPAAPAPQEQAQSPWLTVAPEETDREPQWPIAPTWPSATNGREMPTSLAGRPLLPQADPSGLWAASAREVLTGAQQAAPSPSAAPAPTAQPCVSCGLSLSANARFCRRCGTRQG